MAKSGSEGQPAVPAGRFPRFWSERRPAAADANPCPCFWNGAPPVPAPPNMGKWRLIWNNDLAGGPGWDWENVE